MHSLRLAISMLLIPFVPAFACSLDGKVASFLPRTGSQSAGAFLNAGAAGGKLCGAAAAASTTAQVEAVSTWTRCPRKAAALRTC